MESNRSTAADRVDWLSSRRVSRRGFIARSGAAGVAAAVLAGMPLSRALAQSSGPSLDQFTVAQDIDPGTMNPTQVNRTQARNVYATIFDPLMHYDVNSQIQPHLATKWDWTDDLTLRMTIRSDVKFHDDTALTASDVAYTFQQASQPTSALSGQLKRITSVTAVDPQTVEIKVSERDPLLLKRITDDIYVIPAAYHQKVGNDGFEQKPIGSGPFTFTEWLKSDHVTVDANASYWGGAPAIKQVIFKAIPEPTTRVSTVQSGGADLGTYVPVALLDPIKQDSSVELLIGSSPDALYIGMAVSNPILADQRVRQAINYAVDVEAITKKLGGPDAKALAGMILPGMLGFDESLQPYGYDPDKAKALLKEAGHGDGFDVVFDVPDGRVPSPNDTAAVIASYLNEVGIKANVQVHAFDEFADYLYKRNGKAMTGLWYFHAKSSVLDPDDLLNPSFHTGGIWNWGDVNNPDLDKMLDQAYLETDEAKRGDLYKQINALVRDQAYYVPLYQLIAYYVAKKSDHWTWTPRPDEMIFVASDVAVK